jgi:hypothetical protein
MGGWVGLRNGWMGGFKEWVDGWAYNNIFVYYNNNKGKLFQTEIFLASLFSAYLRCLYSLI